MITLRIVLRSVVAVLLGLVAAAGDARAQHAPGKGLQAGVGIDLPSPGLAVAVSEEAGSVAVVMPEDQLVRLYPRLLSDGDAAGAIDYTAAGAPIDVVHRRLDGKGVFLVLTHHDRTLHVLDDRKLGVVAKVELLGERPVDMAVASNGNVPFLYYVHAGAGTGRVSRVNLKAMRDEGPVEMGWESVGGIELSADGRVLYARASSTGPNGLRSYAIEEPKAPGKPAVGTRVLKRDNVGGRCVADPYNRYVATDRMIYSADLWKQIGQVAAPVLYVMRTRPVMFGDGTDRVLAFSSNGFQGIGSAAVEPGPAGPAAEAGRGGAVAQPARGPRPLVQEQQQQFFRIGDLGLPYQTVLAADEQREAVVVVRRSSLSVLPLRAFGLKDEPMLVAEVRGETSVTPGVPAELTVRAIGDGVGATLEGGPAGMKLEKGKLTWTPEEGQVGEARVRLRLAADGLHRTQELTLRVARPHAQLSFAPHHLHVSPDGRMAVAAGPEGETRPDAPAGAVRQSRVALVDLERQAVVVERVVPYWVYRMAIDTHHAYVTTQESNAMYVMSRTDLSDVRRVFLPAAASAITPSGGTLVVNLMNGQVARYSVPQLELVTPRFEEALRTPDAHGSGAAQPMAGGFYSQGVLWSEDGKAKLLVRPEGLADITYGSMQQLPWRSRGVGDGPAPVARWNVRLSAHQLMRLSGQLVGVAGGQWHELLDEIPAVASLVMIRGQGDPATGRGPSRRAELVFRELLSASARQTVVLFDETWSPPQQGEEACKLVVSRGMVAVQVGSRIFAVPFERLRRELYPEPLHFVPVQETLVLDAQRPTKITATAKGGRGKLTYALPMEVPGVDVNAATGETTVNPGPLVERGTAVALQLMANRAHVPFAGRPTGTTVTPREALDAAAMPERQRFKRITGKEAVGMPVAVPVDLIVRDEEQQVAVLCRVVLLDVPPAKIVALVEKQREDAKKQREGQRLAMENEAAARGNASLRQRVEELTSRVVDLERRNTELEAQNTLLRELVAGQRQQQKGEKQGLP
jgi:hypothetical protein